ncbi:MAG: hypothetical protein MUE40_14270 [Anaerolineae bacterium]|nr:hypothetical protein [Anaerolineae bacterium]
MGVRFAWYDDAQTVMHYIIEGDWNWHDYHLCVRSSLFALHRHPHPVQVLVDLRGSTRPQLPSGLAAHVRSFGRRFAPAFSGRAVVIGLPAAAEHSLGTGADRTLPNLDGGTVHFVDDEAALAALLAAWRTPDQP